MKKISIVLIIIFVSLVSLVTLAKILILPRLYVQTQDQWSIGIYKMTYDNSTGFKLAEIPKVENPIITYKDIVDKAAEFVADPFIVKENNKFYIFFETKDKGKGVISLAESSDCIHWAYKGTVLEEPFHLSFPQIFKYNNIYYMLPESGKIKEIRLYASKKFPYEWNLVKTLISGRNFIDSIIFYYQNKWWIITTESNYLLRLFYADDLMGNWTEHPKSPIVKNNPNTGRLGGNIIGIDNRIIRIAQDCFPTYGNSIRAFEITKLDITEYGEKELSDFPQLKASGVGWNKDGMHTLSTQEINTNEWLACVDGSFYLSNPYVSSKYKIRINNKLLRLLNLLLN